MQGTIASGVVALVFIAMMAINLVGYVSARNHKGRRNMFFGIRTPKTLRNDEAWDASQLPGWNVRLALVPMYGFAGLSVISNFMINDSTALLLPLVSIAAIVDIIFSIFTVRAANHAASSRSA